MRSQLTYHAAEAADHGDFARLVRELHTDDPVPERAHWLADMAPGTFFLRDASGANVAYAFVEVFGADGYVRHLVVDPAHRGIGVGRALMRAALEQLRARGCRRWRLNVKRDNAVAIGLYESFGLRVQHSTHVVRLPWSAVSSLPSPPSSSDPLEVSRVDPADDARIEARFGLPTGLPARMRAQHGAVLIQARRAGAPVAFARFNPTFPGCFPFHVEAETYARPLLEALRPHARPGDERLQLVIEDDERTAAVLVAAGAVALFEIVHMRGDLPRA